MAAPDVSQVTVLVVVDAESPVGLHGGEAVVTGLQRINPDGTRVHAEEKQLPVGAANNRKLRACEIHHNSSGLLEKFII